MNLVTTTIIFALIAPVANIGEYDLVIRIRGVQFDILAPILVGTGVGFVIKYVFNKRDIFCFCMEAV